jgi:hypothetical protein
MGPVIWFVTGLWVGILPSPFAKASAGQAEAQRAQSQTAEHATFAKTSKSLAAARPQDFFKRSRLRKINNFFSGKGWTSLD